MNAKPPRKLCTRCNRARLTAEFTPDASRKDGLRAYCKPCEAEMRRERRLRRGAPAVAESDARPALQVLPGSPDVQGYAEALEIVAAGLSTPDAGLMAVLHDYARTLDAARAGGPDAYPILAALGPKWQSALRDLRAFSAPAPAAGLSSKLEAM